MKTTNYSTSTCPSHISAFVIRLFFMMTYFRKVKEFWFLTPFVLRWKSCYFFLILDMRVWCDVQETLFSGWAWAKKSSKWLTTATSVKRQSPATRKGPCINTAKEQHLGKKLVLTFVNTMVNRTLPLFIVFQISLRLTCQQTCLRNKWYTDLNAISSDAASPVVYIQIKYSCVTNLRTSRDLVACMMHNTSSPGHHQFANGKAESAVKMSKPYFSGLHRTVSCIVRNSQYSTSGCEWQPCEKCFWFK